MSTERFSLAMNEISDRYIEEALTYQAPARRHHSKALGMVLAACLALIIALGTAMAVSPQFRQVVTGWFKEQYEAFTHYEYRNDPAAEGSTGFIPHRLAEIPPGYTETDHICDMASGQQLTVYRNETDGRACLITAGTDGNAYVESEGCTIRPVEVAGTAGELYIPDDPAKDSSLVWMKGSMFFCISGHFTPGAMVYYAERFLPLPAQENTPLSEIAKKP